MSTEAKKKVPLDKVPEIKTLLSEARRTYDLDRDAISGRFVEMRPGLISTLLAKSHHVIQGRRGTGKSTVLQVLNYRAQQEHVPVAIVDMEQHKHRHYPDVLVEVLIDILERLRPKPTRRAFIWQHARIRRQVSGVIRQLQTILTDPITINRSVRRERRSFASATGRLRDRNSLDLAAGASIQAENGEIGTIDSTKIERLRSLAPEINRLLSTLVEQAPEKRSLIFIDDYYFIATEDQPYVLDYLHSVCKGTGVWLKVGGVGSRLKLYQEGDPPVGVQVDQDISRLKLDVTLEDFTRAKSFLEQVLNGILRPVDVTASEIMNDGARNRIVLACGGAVPRDYISLVLDAVDIAIDRNKLDDPVADFRIQTEDINRAAKKKTNQKEEEELKQDAEADAPKLRTRWQDIQSFANSRGQTNFVLFRQGDLTDTAWGKEIEQLENLRLLHRIGTAVPNTKTWRQVRVIIMMIDLAAIMNHRLNTNIVEFWKGQQEFDKLRRAQWVYDPNWKDSLPDDDEQADEVSKAKKTNSGNDDAGLW